MVRVGKNNPNWKSGISKITIADHYLDVPPKIQSDILNKYLKKTEKSISTGCWNYTGWCSGPYRRAMTYIGRTSTSVARVVYVLFYKEKIEHLHVLHKCDNPRCINPNHLFLGTHKDNILDMVTKKRSTKGEKNAKAKLAATDVKSIRKMYRRGFTRSQLALQYNVKWCCIDRIIKGVSWRHLK